MNELQRYWLCCGSTDYPHVSVTCYEANMGHPERVRYGTVDEHAEWARKRAAYEKEPT